MLPFLKNRDDVAISAPPETIERKPDDGESFSMFRAVAQDMLAAFKNDDEKLLTSVLEAFAEHLQDMDKEQDKETLE